MLPLSYVLGILFISEMPCAAGFFKIGSQKSLEGFAILLENPAPENRKAGGWTTLLAKQELHHRAPSSAFCLSRQVLLFIWSWPPSWSWDDRHTLPHPAESVLWTVLFPRTDHTWLGCLFLHWLTKSTAWEVLIFLQLMENREIRCSLLVNGIAF